MEDRLGPPFNGFRRWRTEPVLAAFESGLQIVKGPLNIYYMRGKLRVRRTFLTLWLGDEGLSMGNC